MCTKLKSSFTVVIVRSVKYFDSTILKKPKVNFMKVGRKAQIIEVALCPTPRPNFLRSF